jgi:hypothetical protein
MAFLGAWPLVLGIVASYEVSGVQVERFRKLADSAKPGLDSARLYSAYCEGLYSCSSSQLFLGQ